MSQGDQFHQYGYDHYLKAPKKPRPAQPQYRNSRSGLFRNIQSPALASMVLMGSAALFVSVIVMTYPTDEQKIHPIPIVKADLSPVKERPADVGGMDIPHKQSTVLARSDLPSAQDEQKKIENLLARRDEAPMSKGEAISQSMAEQDDEMEMTLPRSEESNAINILSADISEAVEQDKSEAEAEVANNVDAGEKTLARIKPAFEIKEPKADDILQKIGSTQSKDTDGQSEEFTQKVAMAALSSKPVRSSPPKAVHAAGQSPETIEYVRSVLGEKDVPQQPQDIEPAVGASVNTAITAGMYFVQLASITDPTRAASEWAKMQKKYGILMKSKFRIQEASLSNGKFYRIQAGPMSKSSANKICDELKRAKKPGGCLVVK